MSAAISATDLAFSYGEVRAVDGVSFEVAPGEILGFLGPNGAGKSTTIKMLIGQLKPQRGAIEILGMRIPDRIDEVHARIGVCFEEKNLYPRMTARGNLEFFAKLFGVDIDAEELLRKVDLAGKGEERVENYSKGMKQRLMIARAILL